MERYAETYRSHDRRTQQNRPRAKKRNPQASDRELLKRLQSLAEELGHLPKRSEVPFAFELKGRFGPWPRVLEAAGLKEVGERYQRKQQKKKERRENRGKKK